MIHSITLRNVLLLFIAIFLLVPQQSWAEVEVNQAWVRSPPLDAGTASFYATIRNTGTSDDALVGLRCSLAEETILHETKMVGSKDNSHLRMLMVDELALPAHQTLILSPGHAHAMMIGLKKNLHQGDLIKVELLFAHHKPIVTDAIVHGNLK